MTIRRLGLPTMLCMLAACAAPSDFGSVNEDDYKVAPADRSATLVVTMPAGAATATIRVMRADGTGSMEELAPGTAKALSPGQYCVWTNIAGFDTQRDCRVQVAAGTQVTYALGAVKFTRSSTDLLFGLDWPRELVKTVAQYFLLRKEVLPHPAGNFNYPYSAFWSDGTMDAIDVDVSEHEVTTIDLASTHGRFALRLLPSTGKALPNHPLLAPGDGPYVSVHRGVSSLSWQFEPLDAPVLIRGTGRSAFALTFNYGASGARWEDVRRPFAPPGAPPAVVQLGRLDVDTVVVTMPDSTVARANGTWNVVLDGKVLMSGLRLGYGVDLPSRKYDVTVSYKHPVDDALRSQSFVADVQ